MTVQSVKVVVIANDNLRQLGKDRVLTPFEENELVKEIFTLSKKFSCRVTIDASGLELKVSFAKS
jgi:uncharacterized coiled-coil DUF342 family protein